MEHVAFTLGWARKNKSAQNQLLAWAHMPMGIESSHTNFGVIWSSQLVAVSCSRFSPPLHKSKF